MAAIFETIFRLLFFKLKLFRNTFENSNSVAFCKLDYHRLLYTNYLLYYLPSWINKRQACVCCATLKCVKHAIATAWNVRRSLSALSGICCISAWIRGAWVARLWRRKTQFKLISNMGWALRKTKTLLFEIN